MMICDRLRASREERSYPRATSGAPAAALLCLAVESFFRIATFGAFAHLQHLR
jgi:hypothetical protein